MCRMEFEPEEEVVMLPCKHLYHGECIAQWLQDRKVGAPATLSQLSCQWCPCGQPFFLSEKHGLGACTACSTAVRVHNSLPGDGRLIIMCRMEDSGAHAWTLPAAQDRYSVQAGDAIHKWGDRRRR